MTIENKIINEMTEFKKEMLQNDKEKIFDSSFKISTYETAEVFFNHYLCIFTDSELNFLETTENILFQFYDYYSQSESGEIDEEMIREFVSYSIEIRDTKDKIKEINDIEITAKKTYRYSELSNEAKQKAYDEALIYIEAEYKNNKDILKNKVAHANDEAKNRGIYYKDGSFADLI